MKEKIDVYLISGFLGSGKTTFLQKMLDNYSGIKVGVIVNEFGSIGIDGTLLERDGIQLAQINNGSIFCSCLKGSFVKTLIEFSKLDIDILLIENSGMADPSNIHQIIGELEGKCGRPIHYRGAVCIVDSVSFLKYVQVLTPVQNQIASSNFIIINKIDLVNQSTIHEINAKIKEVNPQAYIYETMYSEVPALLLNEKLTDNGYIGETSNKCYNRPASYSVEGDGNYAVEQLKLFIEKMSGFILRMKGFLKVESSWWQVDVVDSQVDIKLIELSKKDVITKTKLVVIGHDETEFEKELETAWSEVFMEAPTIYE